MSDPNSPAAEPPSASIAEPRVVDRPFHDQTDIDDKSQDWAWTPPTRHELVLWDNRKPGPHWEPYIIKVVSLNEPLLAFVFQKENGWGKKVFEVNLDDPRCVWRDLPSTLVRKDGSPIQPGDAGFLFLTDQLSVLHPEMYKDGHKPKTAPAIAGPGTGGGGKWPKAGGALLSAREAISRLTPAEVAVLAEELAARVPPP